MSVTDNIERCHPCARAAGSVPRCPASGVTFLSHAEADYCPLVPPRFGSGVRPAHFGEVSAEAVEAAAARLREVQERWKDERGRAAWHRLHTEGVGEGPDWLSAWEKTIPCGVCRQKYNALKTVRPPMFPLQAEWTWWLHDSVNAAVGHARPQYADVAPLYGW